MCPQAGRSGASPEKEVPKARRGGRGRHTLGAKCVAGLPPAGAPHPAPWAGSGSAWRPRTLRNQQPLLPLPPAA